ncbi:hypothetical protein Q8A67_001481 [Cirrhinus molitorella]|uniref:SNTX thioredoxin-like domain-containing protein n=1 Tax=Cirrhinus molitorella TaxID=172907 RepID=A0AA88TXS9_9TELE|nr:hypothetical protein Q8A67_001481 [Cirrhinus molitorella]
MLKPKDDEIGILTEETIRAPNRTVKTQALPSDTIEVAALGTPPFPGMLYDCRKDCFLPGVTLWDNKSLSEDLDSRPKPQTYLKFSSADSLSSKLSLLNASASLKASFLGGLVEVGGSAKYLHDTKSSNRQSRITMYYGETTRYEQLTMRHLDQITYPEVFDQKTATRVVTGVLYGAQAFMVFDRTLTEEENKQKFKEELNAMVEKIPELSTDGNPALQMTNAEKKMVENITCTFHGDVRLQQNPTTYMEALNVYKQLPALLKDNPQNEVPIKVWLIYKAMLLEAVGRVLPAVRGGKLEEESLEDILKIHRSSPFNADTLNQWLNDAKSELDLLSFFTKPLEGIQIVDSRRLIVNPDFPIVFCLTFTSLKYEDLYLSALKEFLKTERFKGIDGEQNMVSVVSVEKWFADEDIVERMRFNNDVFKSFVSPQQGQTFLLIISDISDPSNPGSTIYMYEFGELSDKEVQKPFRLFSRWMK